MPTLIAPADIIVGAWQNVTKNYRTYAGFALWYLALSVASWALQLLSNELFPSQLMRTVAFALLSLPLALVAMSITAAVIDATAKLVRGQKVTQKSELLSGLHHLVPFVWVWFLMALTFIGGLVLFLVPFFIFFVWFRFAVNFVVVDDVRGTDAMRASKRLSSGKWWAVFLRIMVPGVFYYVLSLFLTKVLLMAAGAALGDAGMFFVTGADVTASSASQLFAMLVLPQLINAFLTLPLVVSSDIILWLDLKRSAGM